MTKALVRMIRQDHNNKREAVRVIPMTELLPREEHSLLTWLSEVDLRPIAQKVMDQLSKELSGVPTVQLNEEGWMFVVHYSLPE